MLTAVTVVVLAGCAGDDSTPKSHQADTRDAGATTTAPRDAESAGEFMARITRYLDRSQYGRAWLELHPAQRRVVSRERLAECYGTAGGQNPAAKLRVSEVYDEPWLVAGAGRFPSKAVTIERVLTYTEEGQTVTSVLETTTSHAFRVRGRWAWILGPSSFADAKAGNC